MFIKRNNNDKNYLILIIISKFSIKKYFTEAFNIHIKSIKHIDTKKKKKKKFRLHEQIRN